MEAGVRNTLLVAISAIFSFRLALADEILFPAPAIERSIRLDGVYHLDKPSTGTGVLRVEWSDVAGRIVEQRGIPFVLKHQSDIPFHLDTRRAVATLNEVQVHLDFTGFAAGEAPGHRELDTQAPFILKQIAQPWSDYQIIMWQSRTPIQYMALKELGITAGKIEIDRSNPLKTDPKQTDPLLASDLPWYVENIASDFYSAYHRWFPGRRPNWRFTEIQKQYLDNPLDPRVFVREPSLSDPVWLERIRHRLTDVVRAQRDYRPLYYSLADESGIADLAAFWDFDFSQESLRGMRQWLRERYGTLASLNREWNSEFPSWEAVVPMGTKEAIESRDDDFAPWADFKEWMDVAFARALRLGSDAVHAADPTALAALEGAQPPGWGGYDYTLLAHSVDLMEMYDSGENVDIVHSLNPNLSILTTSFKGGPGEEHRVWRELLHGSSGLILWDDKNEFVREDGALADRGLAAEPYFHEIRAGLGMLLINSQPLVAPVAILNSPMSMRIQWMLDWKSKGDAWSRRDSEQEGGDDNTVRSVLHAYSRIVERLGFTPRFVSPELIERGDLQNGGYRFLMLPHAIALSQREAHEIYDFVDHGGTILADTEPGQFDADGRKLQKPLLADFFHGSPTDAIMPAAPGKGNASYWVPAPQMGGAGSLDLRTGQQLRELFESKGVVPSEVLRRSDGGPVTDVETHLFANGGVTIIALQRDLASAADAGEDVTLSLPKPAFVYDLRREKALGHLGQISLVLDPIKPTLLAVSNAALGPPVLSVPLQLRLGDTAQIRIEPAGPRSLTRHVLRLEVIDPTGKSIRYYSGTILASAGVSVSRSLPLALNDPAGKWQIRVTDVLSGGTATAEIDVIKP